MKKFLISAALIAAISVSTSAQQIEGGVIIEDDLSFVPSTLTSSSKPVALGFNSENATIYDSDFNVVKKFNIKTENVFLSKSYREIATIKPTAAKIVGEYAYPLEEQDSEGWHSVEATDLKTLINKVSSIRGYTCYGFIDEIGRISCWYEENGGPCYAEDLFGKKYFTDYYCIIDGIVNSINVQYEYVINESDIANAEWTLDTDYGISEYESNVEPEDFDYYDFDSNFSYDDLVFSQTLFNEDDKWEYIVPLYGPLEKIVEEPQFTWQNGEIVYYRYVHENNPSIGYAIYNEDGKLLATFDSKDWLDDIIKFNGTSYLVTSGDNTTLYKLDSKISSIKEVKQFNAKAFSVGVNNRSITVDTGDQKADEAILFDMQGRKVAVSSNQNSNRLSINAGNVPQGIYNVTVKNQGKMERAQKVRIK